jgi:hypothetical protein
MHRRPAAFMGSGHTPRPAGCGGMAKSRPVRDGICRTKDCSPLHNPLNQKGF